MSNAHTHTHTENFRISLLFFISFVLKFVLPNFSSVPFDIIAVAAKIKLSVSVYHQLNGRLVLCLIFYIVVYAHSSLWRDKREKFDTQSLCVWWLVRVCVWKCDFFSSFVRSFVCSLVLGSLFHLFY